MTTSTTDEIGELRERLREAGARLERIEATLNIPRSPLRRALRFVRREYGFIGFLLVGAAAVFYSARYRVSPFHELGGPARSEALARSYTTIGDGMMAAGDWSAAGQAFDEALKLDPRNERASYHAHVARLLTIGEPAVVGGALARLAEETGDDAVILFAQGTLCLRSRQYGRAAEFFRRSIAVDRAFTGARVGLGVAGLRLGDRATYYEQAAAVYRLDSGLAVAVGNLAWAYELRHEHREATRLYLRMDTIAGSARTLWLVGTSMLHHDPAGAERFLGECVVALQRDTPEDAAELGGAWPVAYVPADTVAPISDADIVTVTARPEKLACALVSYAASDALAGNVEGAAAKLDRAASMITRNGALRRILGLQLESFANRPGVSPAGAEWLRRAAQDWSGGGR